MVFAAKCLATVFRDTPVSREISRIDSFCRVSATPPPFCHFRLDPAILRAWA